MKYAVLFIFIFAGGLLNLRHNTGLPTLLDHLTFAVIFIAGVLSHKFAGE